MPPPAGIAWTAGSSQKSIALIRFVLLLFLPATKAKLLSSQRRKHPVARGVFFGTIENDFFVRLFIRVGGGQFFERGDLSYGKR